MNTWAFSVESLLAKIVYGIPAASFLTSKISLIEVTISLT